MEAPGQMSSQHDLHWPFRASRVIALTALALPTAAIADEALELVAAPKEFIGQQVTVSCVLAYAQESSPTWCEVYDSSEQEAGTILFYLTHIAPEEDRARAMRECGNLNPRRNNRDRCLVNLTGRVGVQFQNAFLSDPVQA